jgi:HD-GYP domain-containing protein (c-di-GMP phosphodiesterase class II)
MQHSNDLGNSFFSIGQDFIVLDVPMPYDLYVNSSALADKEKFVRIFPTGQPLTKQVLDEFIQKYLRLYVPEIQRSKYMRSLVNSKEADRIGKANFIKESAILYLDELFNKKKEFNTEVLSQTIRDSREAVESMVDVLHDYKIDDLRKMIGNLSFHDFYTFDHSINVAMYSITIYKAYKPEAKRIELVHAGLGGLLHDLGKVKIPTDILNNPGKLSEAEYNEIKKHPDFGLELLLSGHCEVAEDIDLKAISRVIHEHHENVDGSGYPRKIKAIDISLYARVVAIADFFDAITTKRSYTQVLELDEALKVMSRTVGIKIDGDIFKVFTQETKKIILKDTIKFELDLAFDPTIPHAELPLKPIDVIKEEKDFGKIIQTDKNKKGS